MERSQEPPFNAQIYQRACEWFVELRTHQPDEQERRAFNQWLQASPQHIQAYLHVTAVWSEGPSLGARQGWTVESLIADAARDESNVVAIDGSSGDAERVAPESRRDSDEMRRPRSFGARLTLAACALIAAVGLSTWSILQRGMFTTGIGEQRFISLVDGSTVTLNARSRLRVRAFGKERVVELLQGQALFEVAKDPSRPFVVISGATRVRAVGTQFDVYRKHDDTIVTVVEGRVAIPRESGTAAGEVLLAAGEQLLIAPSKATRTAAADIARATAWTQRQLIFESTPLSEVVEEFNRYNSRPMVIASAELQALPIDGVFASTDPGSLIRFLRTRPGIRVTETESKITVESL